MRYSDSSPISVIVPVYNGERHLHKFFASIDRQDIDIKEILVSDSASSDDSKAVCIENGARVVDIPQGSFDHGGTRTLLARAAQGTILVFCTQDVVLAADDSLRQLVAPLQEDEELACTYGRQLANEDATLGAAHLRDFNYPPESERRSFADRTEMGLHTIFLSNSFAAYKKERLAAVDYFKNNLIFGEDTCTLGRLLQAGNAVLYVSRALVYHSHNYSVWDEFRRSFDIGVLHTEESWLLQTYGAAEGLGRAYLVSGLRYISRRRRFWLLPGWIWRVAAKYLAYRLGRRYTLLPQSLCCMFSSHRGWWKIQ